MKYFLLTGPTAAGKSVIMDYMLIKDKDYLTPIIPFTTRDKRNDEINAKDYYFITKDEYLEYCQRMKIVEQITFMDQVYGVSTDEITRIIESEKNGLAIFTMEGIKILKAQLGYHKTVSIFIYRDLSEIIGAIRGARLDKAEQEKRIQLAKEQMKYIDACDYTVFNIGSLEDVYQEIRHIMRREIDSQLEDIPVKKGLKFENQHSEVMEIIGDLAENTVNGSACVIYKPVNGGKILVSPYEKFIAANRKDTCKDLTGMFWPVSSGQ